MLQVEGLHAHYGAAHVLHGVTMLIESGTAVGLLGRNGMGKTTLIRTIMGYVPATEGCVQWGGRDLTGAPPERMARLGIGYVPEGRGIFPNLTVRENLVMAARPGTDGTVAWTFERVLGTFPRLASRLAHGGQQLSGGEQQMLAIARALMTNPSVLLMDEPTEGLAPVIVQALAHVLAALRGEGGLSIVLVEQNSRVALDFSARTVVMDRGRVVYDGSSERLRRDPEFLASLIAAQ